MIEKLWTKGETCMLNGQIHRVLRIDKDHWGNTQLTISNNKETITLKSDINLKKISHQDRKNIQTTLPFIIFIHNI
jgi:hypothetical protein